MRAFTSSDRVLLFLLMKGDRTDNAGGTTDQDEIAACCGIGRTHVPRALKPLITDGFVEGTQGRTPGRARRVKLYSLTAKGITAALALRDRVTDITVEWTDDHGRFERENCVDALRKINDRLGASSMNRIPISLFLALGKNSVGWNELLELSSSLLSMRAGVVSLPEGWRPLAPPDPPQFVIDRTMEMEGLLSMLEHNGVSIIVGDRGAGKRTLVQLVTERSGLRVLWLSRDGEKEYHIEPSGYDIMVMIGVQMIDLSSVLIGEGRTDLKDPRDKNWPEELLAMPLLGILEGDLEAERDDIMSLGGLKERDFMEKAVEMGMMEGLAREYFKATHGIPSALSYLGEIDPSALTGLGTLDMEAALMSLMLGLRSRY
ncbi:MAG: hypothetical protein JXA22_06835 [Candidatus Thermoplasmatota archaeon]|nr:hypothetical protein [Candidatus Thermoplasmatota archaeon]